MAGAGDIDRRSEQVRYRTDGLRPGDPGKRRRVIGATEPAVARHRAVGLQILAGRLDDSAMASTLLCSSSREQPVQPRTNGPRSASIAVRGMRHEQRRTETAMCPHLHRTVLIQRTDAMPSGSPLLGVAEMARWLSVEQGFVRRLIAETTRPVRQDRQVRPLRSRRGRRMDRRPAVAPERRPRRQRFREH